jgi:hypothetical protein
MIGAGLLIGTMLLTLGGGLVMHGCSVLHVAGGGRKPTAIEQVLTWNAALADANLSVAQGVIAANQANQIDVPTSNAILTEQSRIADADRQLTPILAKACSPQATIQACNPAILSGDAVMIQNFLAVISVAGQNLVKDGTAGIKNPQRAQSVGTAIASINTLAGEMTQSLKALGILK